MASLDEAAASGELIRDGRTYSVRFDAVPLEAGTGTLRTIVTLSDVTAARRIERERARRSPPSG